MRHKSLNLLIATFLTSTVVPATADVITDWNEKAVAIVTPRTTPPVGERVMAIMHVAMFDAVNSIEPRYQPYLARLPATPDTSKEAAAAVAAGTVLVALQPDAAGDVKTAMASYLAAIPDSPAKANGARLGEAVAAKVLAARVDDGADAPDAYRPKAKPGVYVPTPITLVSQWSGVKPFALTKASQFRPGPPISLTSKRWAEDYNELKEYGGKTSVKRSPRQTEDGKFWFTAGPQSYHPVARQLVALRTMSVVDSARYMAFVAIAANDAYIAVFDAKYHYDFWRPITAIRNGDIDGNPATARDTTWQPLGNTPMHPEYPCAHCISSTAVATVMEAIVGGADVPELTATSPTAPGTRHSWTNLRRFADEVSEARIWAGFHYRFSIRVGQDMGRKIGDYVVKNVMQPVTVAKR